MKPVHMKFKKGTIFEDEMNLDVWIKVDDILWTTITNKINETLHVIDNQLRKNVGVETYDNR